MVGAVTLIFWFTFHTREAHGDQPSFYLLMSVKLPLSRIEFAAGRACNYVCELDTGQSARRVGFATRTSSRSKYGRDHSRFSRHVIVFIPIDSY